MQILSLDEIKARLDELGLARIIALQEEGFAAYSNGDVKVPPVLHLGLNAPASGDLHVKVAHIKGGHVFVLKGASGFYNNQKNYGISPSQGFMMLFDANTGVPLVFLEDHGYLTDYRTALAGHIAAKHMAPTEISGIGVLGTGIQARLQIEQLETLTQCRNLSVWGRTPSHVELYVSDMEERGWTVHTASSPAALAARSNLIVTTTAAKQALLHAKDIQPGTHITALGTDTAGKQELAPEIYKRADVCVVDSISQCADHGNEFYALKSGTIKKSDLHELGAVISSTSSGRINDQQITIVSLTGVGVQDLQIAQAAAARLLSSRTDNIQSIQS